MYIWNDIGDFLKQQYQWQQEGTAELALYGDSTPPSGDSAGAVTNHHWRWSRISSYCCSPAAPAIHGGLNYHRRWLRTSSDQAANTNDLRGFSHHSEDQLHSTVIQPPVWLRRSPPLSHQPGCVVSGTLNTVRHTTLL